MNHGNIITIKDSCEIISAAFPESTAFNLRLYGIKLHTKCYPTPLHRCTQLRQNHYQIMCIMLWNNSNFGQSIFRIFRFRTCPVFALQTEYWGDELPILFTAIGRWWGTDPAKHEQVEIDLVANDGNDYMFCECKWRNEKLDLPVLTGLMYKTDVFRKNAAEHGSCCFRGAGLLRLWLKKQGKTAMFCWLIRKRLQSGSFLRSKILYWKVWAVDC